MKEVKIIGLKLNHSLGIVQACNLVFDEENRLIIFKGGVGDGKTTMQKALQLGTQGSKTLVDNDLYGDIDEEVPLLDGDFPIWVGCRSKDKKLQYTLYTKDANGKKVKNPIIDGVEATPAKYLEALQTELTWKMDELTSENPSIQKKILLKLYQHGLKKIGIIFDKMHPDYKASILGQIDEAVNARDMADMIRKQKGGIADDLKAKGHDPDRPETCPDEIKIEEIELEIKALEKEKTQKETNSESVRDKDLAEIKSSAQEMVNRCLIYNKDLKDGYDVANDFYSTYIIDFNCVTDDLLSLKIILGKLDLENEYPKLKAKVKFPDKIIEPKTPSYIIIDKNNQVKEDNLKDLDEKAKMLVNNILKLREKYITRYSEQKEFDSTKIDENIKQLILSKINAINNNKIVDAIDSFHKWRDANETVVRLKNDYVKLLAQVDTGVEGFKIVPDDDQIYGMYDGSYDPKYFGNPNKELRKLSSYSGTQKPVICLLIQNYLLSKKEKAMRYMYIDNIPIDNKTRALIEKMCIELNLRVFLNITGDFSKDGLVNGEILIEGGHVFF